MSLSDLLDQIDPLEVTGRVAQAVGLVIEGTGIRSTVGDICQITREDGNGSIPAEVVGFRGDRVLLMPLVAMSAIMRALDLERQREMWRSVGAGAFLVVVFLFSAWQHFELLRHGYRIEQMQKERAEAEEDRGCQARE
mgnify:CR=1 FL=1